MILFNLSGHGNFDMSAYDAYLSGKLADHEMPDSDLEEALAELCRRWRSPQRPEPPRRAVRRLFFDNPGRPRR